MRVLTELWRAEKALRAKVVLSWAEAAGYGRQVVCFSSGNAARALAKAGMDVLWVGDHGEADLRPGHWYTQAEIRRLWPGRFDATPGHLPPEVLLAVASELAGSDAVRKMLAPTSDYVAIPSGSGETLVAMALAFPDMKFIAQYGGSPATQFSAQAPLNLLVHRLAWGVEVGS